MASRNTRHQRDQKRRQKRRLLHSIYQWHRVIGLGAAFFAVWLSATGIALNHAPRFGLDQQLIKSTTLLSWYGISLSDSSVNEYQYQNDIAWSFQNTAVINSQAVTLDNPVTAMSANGEFWLVASSESLSLVTKTGELVETNTNIPKPATGVQLLNNGQIRLITNQQTYCGSIDFVAWKPCSQRVTVGKTTRPLTPEDANLARAHSITWERVLQDAHSGRLFGLWGTAIADICGVLIILLAFTGSYTWYSRRQRRKKR